MYESYPQEDMLVNKCFMCGRIDSYRELSREESRQLFRRVDADTLGVRKAS
jgi:ribosomal protein S14